MQMQQLIRHFKIVIFALVFKYNAWMYYLLDDKTSFPHHTAFNYHVYVDHLTKNIS